MTNVEFAPILVGRLKRLAIGCLCGAGALAAGACADGGGIPTSPTASVAPSSLAATAPSNVGIVPQAVVAATSANKGRPFHGSFRATETDEFQPPDTLVSHLSGTGNTNFGEFSLKFDEQIVLGETTAAGTGSFTLTATNGGTIIGTVTVFGTYVPVGVRIVEQATITGGTGQFADATGTFTVRRLLLEGTDVRRSAGSFAGTISY
ncbi:MAG: hypothetical protein H0W08_17360 [Acidobacteria bacterium]|nr:hypothetical protein [Acidobacteriota bacterium]